MLVPFCFLMANCLIMRVAYGNERAHEYLFGERMALLIDKSGPFDSDKMCLLLGPYSPCFGCSREISKSLKLDHNSVTSSLNQAKNVHFTYMVPIVDELLCTIKIDEETQVMMEGVIDKTMWVRVRVDTFSFWMGLGTKTSSENGEKYTFYSHYRFTFVFNPPFLLDVGMEALHPVFLEKGSSLSLTYSTVWIHSNQTISRNSQIKDFSNASLLNEKVHWYGVLTGIVLLLLSAAAASTFVFRLLAQKSSSIFPFPPEFQELGNLAGMEKGGWTLLHGDIFRKPSHFLFFSMLIGCGSQVFFVVLLAMIVSFYFYSIDVGNAIPIYLAATQIIGGFVNGFVFKSYGGKRWRRSMMLHLLFSSMLLPAIILVRSIPLLRNRSSISITIVSSVNIVLLFLALNIPLHVIGTLLGRRHAFSNSLMSVSKVRRPIPTRSKLLMSGMYLLGGAFPFMCIYQELKHWLSSLSLYQFDYHFGFLLSISFLYMCIVACNSVTIVSCMLSREDYSWMWASFLSCASTSVFSIISAILHPRRMQFSSDVDYAAFLLTALFLSGSLLLLNGFIGFFASSIFIRRIYYNLKRE